ncbi:YceI family protein [Sphingomonas edaphi]|uniref:Polyisoprenoid-binding protein n=1 Tax=Sphingomonas edaphi TaxID=2315689 RepID=A0A418PYP3_9SPHN|nr:YceI family protein [Sphingomonas edaphi]RIX27118.1 polyisoprenoid-binding protein [Sphingomonas edaphi]
MTRKFAIIAALGLTALSGVAIAQADPFVRNPVQVKSGSYVLDPAHGKITWSVDHMGFSTYVGQFTDVTANLDLDVRNPAASKLDASVKTDSVGTFHEGLDKHLKTADFLDTAKFPTAQFRATGIRLVDRDSAKISGNLTLHGITKPIVIDADFNQAGINPVDKRYSLGFDGEAKIKRSEFGINYGLPLLGNEITLHLEAEFKLKTPKGGA